MTAKKSEQITLRVSPEKKRQVESRAAALELSVTNYMLRLLDKEKDLVEIPAEVRLRLENAAIEVGKSVDDLVRDRLEEETRGRDGANFMAGYNPVYFLRHQYSPNASRSAEPAPYMLEDANLCALQVFAIEPWDIPLSLDVFIERFSAPDPEGKRGYFTNMDSLLENYRTLFADRPAEQTPSPFWEDAHFQHPTFGLLDMEKLAIRLMKRGHAEWTVSYHIRSIENQPIFEESMKLAIRSYMVKPR